MADTPLAGIILAAGKGTRMKSDLPKVLHPVAGVPMVEHVCRAMIAAGVDKIVVVIGHGAELVRERLGEAYAYAMQDPPRGTGDAVRVGLEALGPWEGPILVSAGDTPLIEAGGLREMADRARETGAGCVMATVVLDDATGYGRVVRDGEEVARVVEQKDASEEEKAIREACVSVYAFDGAALAAALPRVEPNNAQGEYYLTDVPPLMRADGRAVLAHRFADAVQFSGVNDRVQLAEAAREYRARTARRWMLAGVTIVDPATAYIGPDVVIGPDTILHPNVHLERNTIIERGCEIGPDTRLVHTHVGEAAKVQHSVAVESFIGARAKVGPYANLRMTARVGEGAKVGNFVEIKNSDLAAGVSVAHLSYIGDAEVGEKTNIGAGTITCNYDGYRKHRTVIGARVFVGTNSTLVAPVNLGDGAFVAAGSVITKDVSGDAMAFGRARQETKEGYAARFRALKAAGL